MFSCWYHKLLQGGSGGYRIYPPALEKKIEKKVQSVNFSLSNPTHPEIWKASVYHMNIKKLIRLTLFALKRFPIYCLPSPPKPLPWKAFNVTSTYLVLVYKRTVSSIFVNIIEVIGEAFQERLGKFFKTLAEFTSLMNFFTWKASLSKLFKKKEGPFLPRITFLPASKRSFFVEKLSYYYQKI